jgi:AcrR family transcriptional regulator
VGPNLGADSDGPPSLRTEQKRFTRLKLLQSAALVFAERGYVKATIDDIVAGAGASRGTLYLYFPSKGSLILEVMAEGWGAGLDTLIAELDPLTLPDEATLRSWIDGYASLFRRHARILRAWLQAMNYDHSLTIQHVDGYLLKTIDGISGVVSRSHAAAGAELTTEDANTLASTMLFELERACFFRYIRNWKANEDLQQKLIARHWYDATRLFEISAEVPIASSRLS